MADWRSPAAEAGQNGNSYRIALELPGVAENGIQATLEDGVLLVRGQKKSEREEKGDTWYFSERQFSSFRMPSDADAAQAKAEMKDGVLTVTVPKKAATQSATRVPISKG